MDLNQAMPMPTPQNPTPPGFYQGQGVSPISNVMDSINSVQQAPLAKTARSVGAGLVGGTGNVIKKINPEVFKSHVTKLLNNLHQFGVPFAREVIDALHEIDPTQAEQKWMQIHAAMDQFKNKISGTPTPSATPPPYYPRPAQPTMLPI